MDDLDSFAGALRRLVGGVISCQQLVPCRAFWHQHGGTMLLRSSLQHGLKAILRPFCTALIYASCWRWQHIVREARQKRKMVNSMTRISDLFEDNSIWSSAVFVLVALILIVCFTTTLAQAQDQSGESIFKNTCTSCHGQNGVPTPVGKSLNAADLSSKAVQSQTDAELHQVISNGKNNMPPFKSSLSDAQIGSVIAYIRTLVKTHK